MAEIEQTDGKLRVAGKTFVRTSDHFTVSDLSVRVDQVALVTEHSLYALPAGTTDKRPSPTLMALQGKATIEGSGVGLAILGSETPPAVQLSIQIAPYDEPKPADDSEWAKRARTSWPASVWWAAGEGWHLTLNLPRLVHEQLTIAVATGRLVHLKCSVKLDAWLEEQTSYCHDTVIYLQLQTGSLHQTDFVSGYTTHLTSRERPLVLTEPLEHAALERPKASPLLKPPSRLRTVQSVVLALVVAVILIWVMLLLRN